MKNEFFSDEAFKLIEKESELHLLADGYFFTEGPVWSAGEQCLYYTNFADNTIYRMAPGDKPVLFRSNSGRAVGLSICANGTIVSAETASHAVTMAYADHSEIICNQYKGQMLNSPNDVIVAANGDVYFTDPYSVAMKGPRELDFNGFYRVRYQDGKYSEAKLLGIMERPNGIALSPDEKILYVNDTNHNHILSYAVRADDTVSFLGIFAKLDASYGPGAADGMKVDIAGNVYVTGPGGIWILSPEGSRIAIIRIPEVVGNFCFGGSDGCTLFAAASKSIYSLKTFVPGVLPRFGA